jgi:hypothetical protein
MCVWLFHFATAGAGDEIRSAGYECARQVRVRPGVARKLLSRLNHS